MTPLKMTHLSLLQQIEQGIYQPLPEGASLTAKSKITKALRLLRGRGLVTSEKLPSYDTGDLAVTEKGRECLVELRKTTMASTGDSYSVGMALADMRALTFLLSQKGDVEGLAGAAIEGYCRHFELQGIRAAYPGQLARAPKALHLLCTVRPPDVPANAVLGLQQRAHLTRYYLIGVVALGGGDGQEPLLWRPFATGGIFDKIEENAVQAGILRRQ